MSIVDVRRDRFVLNDYPMRIDELNGYLSKLPRR